MYWISGCYIEQDYKLKLKMLELKQKILGSMGLIRKTRAVCKVNVKFNAVQNYMYIYERI